MKKSKKRLGVSKDRKRKQRSKETEVVKVSFAYLPEYSLAYEKLNPENNEEIEFKIAKAFGEAYEMQLAMYSDKRIPYYTHWNIENFEDLPIIQQAAWKGVESALLRIAEGFASFMEKEERKEAVLH